MYAKIKTPVLQANLQPGHPLQTWRAEVPLQPYRPWPAGSGLGFPFFKGYYYIKRERCLTVFISVCEALGCGANSCFFEASLGDACVIALCSAMQQSHCDTCRSLRAFLLTPLPACFISAR
jgi:hypothetical protein